MKSPEKFAFNACQAVRAWRRFEEAWPGGMPYPTALLHLDAYVGGAGDRMRLLEAFERFVVQARTAMAEEARLGKAG